MDDQTPEVELEIELLRGAGRGDRRSFEALFERYSGVLFSVAFRVLNDREAAEDVCQDVFVQIWEKAASYDPQRGKPLTWAVTLTRNRAIDRLRSIRRRRRLYDEVEREASVWEVAGDRESAGAVESREKGALMRDAVMRLSKEQREAIELAFYRGMTQTEIAAKLGQPLGTVKARIRRGMLRLREIIEPRL